MELVFAGVALIVYVSYSQGKAGSWLSKHVEKRHADLELSDPRPKQHDILYEATIDDADYERWWSSSDIGRVVK